MKMVKISNYAGLGARQVDPCITGLAMFIVVVRQYGEMFSVTASDLVDNRSVFILLHKNVPRVEKSANLLI